MLSNEPEYITFTGTVKMGDAVWTAARMPVAVTNQSLGEQLAPVVTNQSFTAPLVPAPRSIFDTSIVCDYCQQPIDPGHYFTLYHQYPTQGGRFFDGCDACLEQLIEAGKRALFPHPVGPVIQVEAPTTTIDLVTALWHAITQPTSSYEVGQLAPRVQEWLDAWGNQHK